MTLLNRLKGKLQNPATQAGSVSEPVLDDYKIPEGHLTDLVRERDREAVMTRASSAFHGFTHASSLLKDDYCPRLAVLNKDGSMPSYDWAGTSTRLVWAMGRAVEAHVRQQIFEALSR